MTRDDLRFLGDSLTDVFYNNLDVPVWEGQDVTWQDVMVVMHPEAAMALTTSVAPRKAPSNMSSEEQEFRNNFVNNEGDRIINLPPGPAGNEIRSDALKNGWIVERPAFTDDGGRFADATNTYRRARQKIIRQMWRLETARDWGSDSAETTRDGRTVSGLIKGLQDRTFTPQESTRWWAQQLDLNLPGERMSYQDYREVLERAVDQSAPEPYAFSSLLFHDPVGQALQMSNPDFHAALDRTFRFFQSKDAPAGISGFSDWPQEAKDNVRAVLADEYNKGTFTLEEYRRGWEPVFGPVDFKPPEPPPIPDLQLSIEAKPNQVAVVDGDGLEVVLEDGTVPVRILGLLAPDRGQPGYEEAAENLQRLIDGAETITFGISEPETFGTTQLQGPNRKRAYMWLYVDGVPIWDPSLFTPESPRASSGQGVVSDLQAIYESGR